MTSTGPSAVDPAPRPKRRTFSPECKLQIVAEYEGEKGAILRRERCRCHSHVTEWRACQRP
ncbi:hypothetical protein ACFCZ1_06150 [Streptomyces sp. NPDC056224]|uniref:hypothetical protein n=1 Tax=Streptomyces sp. NPDC056224 TaxID=3345750 RepID=UPI0035D837B2